MKPLHLGRARHTPDSTLPLINIVLLLVLAFMIAGVVETPLPDSFDPLEASGKTSQTPATPPLTLVVTQSGEVLLENQPLESGAVPALLTSDEETYRQLSVKADSRAPAAAVIELLSKAEDAGFKKTVVMTIGTDK